MSNIFFFCVRRTLLADRPIETIELAGSTLRLRFQDGETLYDARTFRRSGEALSGRHEMISPLHVIEGGCKLAAPDLNGELLSHQFDGNAEWEAKSADEKEEIIEELRQNMLETDSDRSLGASCLVFGLLAVRAIWAPVNEFDVVSRWGAYEWPVDAQLCGSGSIESNRQQRPTRRASLTVLARQRTSRIHQ